MIKINPGSRSVGLGFKDKFLKIAVTRRSVSLLRLEMHAGCEAYRHKFWGHYVQRLRIFAGFIGYSEKLRALNLESESYAMFYRKLINHIDDCALLPKEPFLGTIDLGIFEKIQLPERKLFANKLYDRFQEHKVAIGAVHGDLHVAQMFHSDFGLRLIDWGAYRRSFWVKYDLVHLHVSQFLVDMHDSSWACLANEASRDMFRRSSWGLDLTDDEFNLYLVCRCYIELSKDLHFDSLTKNRKLKYYRILKSVI